MKPLEVEYDQDTDMLVVDGVKYSGDFFRTLERMDLMVPFFISERKDSANVILIYRTPLMPAKSSVGMCA